MTDIDFDELDRAVNSIMSGGVRPSANASDKPAVVTTPTASSSSSAVVSAPGDTVPSTPEPIQETTVSSGERSSPSVAIPSRRGGRFMDVVHPSSDMKNSPGTTVRQVSRDAATIEPMNSTASMPDMNELNDLLRSSLPADSSEPTVSPFLTDTKVQKRPLGGESADHNTADAVSEVPVPEPVSESESTEVKVSNITPKDEPSKNEAHEATPQQVMPAELTPDLLSIESSDSDEASESNEATAIPVANITPRPERKPLAVAPRPTQAPVTPPVEAVRPEAILETKSQDSRESTSMKSVAIDQQYSSPQSTSPTETGSIYDTDTYHQPLAHPEKKKSGWMWVVWVFLLLVLGAGGGAIAYFLLIQ